MTDPTTADLRRELRKALDALDACRTHLARHAEANAALHCAQTVMYSPLHARVDATITGIRHALDRTKPTRGVPRLDNTPDGPWAALVADLDRCQHGRHALDTCGDCGTTSHGNPHMKPGNVIGYGQDGSWIVVPPPRDKHTPAAWRRTP